MASGEASVRVVSTVLEESQRAIKAVTTSLLKLEATPSQAPEFLSNSFIHLVPEPDQSLQSFLEDLIYLNQCAVPKMFVSLSVGTAMLEVADASFWARLRSVLIDAEFRIEERTIGYLVALYPTYERLIEPNHYAFRDAQGSHYIFAITLFMTLIGKSLMSVNFAPWMRRRRMSFAGPLSIPITDELLEKMCPSIQVAQAFNEEVRSLWTIRREFFIEIWNQSGKPSLLGRGFQVTLTLLRYAETTICLQYG